jgi:tetratricopeptide (TPR) repeat protein
MRVGLLLVSMAICVLAGQEQRNVRELLQEGNQALEKNQLHEAARAFQKALDMNPSSVFAHEGLGIALARLFTSGGVRPSEDSDTVSRAENHLRQATDLEPSAVKPLLALADLETALAEQADDAASRANRYSSAQDLLKRAVSLESNRADLYLRLALVERDQFGPALQKARAHAGKNGGPIADVELRRELREQYGALLDDSISNAKTAAELDGHVTRPLLLMSRLLRERAVIRDTPQDYSTDMRSADDWQRQFLAAGGHLDQGDSNLK